ncbi:MAG: O-methyltransferase [Paludibacteraceae bacterium]
MTDTLHQIQARIAYIRHAHRKGGYGIHSPFVFHWLNSVLYEQTPFYAYANLRRQRQKLCNDTRSITLQGFGTGAPRQTTIRSITKKSCSKRKYAELLFRIVNSCQARYIIELGTNLGLTTLHMAVANSHARIITLEGEPQLYNLANTLFREQHADNIRAICGNIDHTLAQALQTMPTIDLAFFDANHTGEATLRYFHQCLPHAHKHTLFIFDDIHRSADMEQAWNVIKADTHITVTIDTFQMGFAFFNTDLQKENYIVAF